MKRKKQTRKKRRQRSSSTSLDSFLEGALTEFRELADQLEAKLKAEARKRRKKKPRPDFHHLRVVKKDAR